MIAIACEGSCCVVHSYIITAIFMSCRHIKKVANLLKEVEFIFVPFVNPDGYEVMMT